jgi:hypothetical protein
METARRDKKRMAVFCKHSKREPEDEASGRFAVTVWKVFPEFYGSSVL